MSIVHIPEILFPAPQVDLQKWGIIACDQYTSQREYWDRVEQFVGDAPSTYYLTLPEVYLDDPDVQERIARIPQTFARYQRQGVFRQLPRGAVLVERQMKSGKRRRGIVVSLDLEDYHYQGEALAIRPTEKTIVQRIPPRLAIRKKMSVEFPHTLLLIDDEKQEILEPLFDRVDRGAPLYDLDLMQGGGHITGYFLPEGEALNRFVQKLEQLGTAESFAEKYDVDPEDHPPLTIAVGDGNHSMATAKAYWEEIKQDLTEEERRHHPARYVLAEIVNLHDPALEFEAIHRLLFQIDAVDFFHYALAYYLRQGCRAWTQESKPVCEPHSHVFAYYHAAGSGYLVVERPIWSIAHATLQAAVDEYLKTHKAVREDYIHGQGVVRQLGSQPDNLGFILPDLQKNELFRCVILDGVLPKKTFSMGEADEKRFYLEGKFILNSQGGQEHEE